MEQIKNIIFDVGDVLLSYRWKYMLMDYGLTETEDTGMCIQSLVKSIFLTHSTKRTTDRLKKVVSVRSVKTIREHMYAIF